MPTVTINGRSLTGTADQTILDVARAAGIEIPTLCWYPKLPTVGNCRICLVSVDGQPKLVPACATKVRRNDRDHRVARRDRESAGRAAAAAGALPGRAPAERRPRQQ